MPVVSITKTETSYHNVQAEVTGYSHQSIGGETYVRVELKFPFATLRPALIEACSHCIVGNLCQNRVSNPEGDSVNFTRHLVLFLGWNGQRLLLEKGRSTGCGVSLRQYEAAEPTGI